MNFIDQLNREVFIPFPPKRIISLVPSQTELLFDLGLDEEIVGITKFCVHPSSKVMGITKIGGTKNVKLKRVRDLKPDLIIANKEENDKSQIKTLEKEFPIWISDVYDLSSAIEMIERLGEVLDKAAASNSLITTLKIRFKEIDSATFQSQKLSTAYFIWRKPYMVAGAGTFIDKMLERAGFQNIFKSLNRYPEISLNALKEMQPELILLPSEPFPFKSKHMLEFQNICPSSVIKLVDGELFSWYGSRLLRAPAYFSNLRQEIEKDTSKHLQKN